jgi:putative hydrolase of the HAD superfamily
VLAALGVRHLVEAVVSIESMRFAGRIQPKPSRAMMRRVVARLRTAAANCVLVDDTPANLQSARSMPVTSTVRMPIERRAGAGGRRWRAGRGRRIELQVQSVTQLPREAVRPVEGDHERRDQHRS